MESGRPQSAGRLGERERESKGAWERAGEREYEWSKRERMLTLCTYACYACACLYVCVCGCIHTVSAFVCCGWLMYTLTYTLTHTNAYLPLCSVNMFSPTVGLQRLSLWDALELPPRCDDNALEPLEPMLMPLLPWPADWCDFMREPRSVEPALRPPPPPPPPLELPPLMQCGDPDATGLLLETPMQLTVPPPCPPPPPPLECEPRSLPCWAPILQSHAPKAAEKRLQQQQQFSIHTRSSFLLRWFLPLFLVAFFCFSFPAINNCMHFFFVVFFYILSHSRLLYFNSLLYTFSFVRRRRRRLFSFFREIRSFFAPAPHTVPFCYSTLQFESRQNSRMLRNCQRDFCTGDATTIQQLFFLYYYYYYYVRFFVWRFFICWVRQPWWGGGGSWSTGSGWLAGYKHALKNALCVCPLRLFRLRFLHISHDFFFFVLNDLMILSYSIVLETAALF